MLRTHPIRFFLLILFIQILLVFTLHLAADAQEPPDRLKLQLPGRFYLVDQDHNLLPDHLAFSVWVDGKLTSEHFWLCGELQALIDNNWQTVAFTGRSYRWSNQPMEATIHFYGGELKRLQVNGPFRLILKLKSVGFNNEVIAGFSPSYQYQEFEASDLVWSEGELRKTSEVLKNVLNWAEKKGMILGRLEERTYTFDRWRLDFKGESPNPPRRVWVDPQGNISWVDKKR